MPNTLLISDANILIDMDVAGLLEAMFTLEFDFAVPDVLFEEELRDRHPELPGLGLKTLELTGATIDYVQDLAARYARSRTSRNDLLALALARQEDCELLTGDGDLRTTCGAEGVTVRGTLWLMGQMFDAGLVDATRTEAAYEAMRMAGSRLPWREVEVQLERFRS